MKVLVVDDELAAREELIYHLGLLLPEAIPFEAEHAGQVEQLLEQHHFDVAFLDIHLPGESGTDIALKLADLATPPLIIFATAYNEYALQAFELCALDYITKPFSVRRMEKTIARIRQSQQQSQALTAQQHTIRELIRQKHQTDSAESGLWVIQDNGNRKLISVQDIIYAEASGKSVLLHISDQALPCSYTLKELEQKLSEQSFCRIHKSFLVNLDFVSELVPWFAGRSKVILKDSKQTELQVSRRQLSMLKEKLNWR